MLYQRFCSRRFSVCCHGYIKKDGIVISSYLDIFIFSPQRICDMFKILDTRVTFSKNVIFRERVKPFFVTVNIIVHIFSLKISLKFLKAFGRYKDIFLLTNYFYLFFAFLIFFLHFLH